MKKREYRVVNHLQNSLSSPPGIKTLFRFYLGRDVSSTFILWGVQVRTDTPGMHHTYSISWLTSFANSPQFA